MSRFLLGHFNGMTALHHAVQNFYNYRVEQLQLIQKLIDSGIDINAKDRLGKTAMDLAKAHSQKDVVSGSESVFKLISAGSAQSKKSRVKKEERGQLEIQVRPIDDVFVPNRF